MKALWENVKAGKLDLGSAKQVLGLMMELAPDNHGAFFDRAINLGETFTELEHLLRVEDSKKMRAYVN